MLSYGKTLLHSFLREPPRSPDDLQEKGHESFQNPKDKELAKECTKAREPT
jgi:hypothetical protein